MKDNTAQNHGISLIALVITIIVLLILSGVSISMLTEQNGILVNASKLTSSSAYYEAEEQVKLAYMSLRTEITTQATANSTYDAKTIENTEKLAQIVLNDLTKPGFSVDGSIAGKIKITYTNNKINKESLNGSTPTEDGKVEYLIILDQREASLELDNGNIETIPAKTYTQGEEIEFGGEKFFVLEDLGNQVKLFSKYCLNQIGTTQINEGYITYGRPFSKSYYWENDFTTSPFDLQSEDMIFKASVDGDVAEGIPNAIITAKNYGRSKGAKIGRLMKYNEAQEIYNGSNQTMKNILFGNWTGVGAPTEKYLTFFLGNANYMGNIHGICYNSWSTVYYNSKYPAGVRPVLIVYKL